MFQNKERVFGLCLFKMKKWIHAHIVLADAEKVIANIKNIGPLRCELAASISKSQGMRHLLIDAFVVTFQYKHLGQTDRCNITFKN